MHRKRSSVNRSVEYYRTPEGKFKKKIQNGKRGVLAQARLNHFEQAGSRLVLQERKFTAPVPCCYLRMVISLIEGRRVSAAEILAMLSRVLRQHSIVCRRRIDYVLQYLNKRAP